LLQNSTKFYPVQAGVEGLSFDLVPNPGLAIWMYRVVAELDEGIYTCQCSTFEMWGLLCPHILRVMVHLNVHQIPTRYLIKRWSATATTPAPDPGANSFRFGVPPTSTLKYNSLCRKMNDLASDACYDDETYKTVSTMVDEASRVVAMMRRARHNEQQSEGERAELQDNGHNSGITSNNPVAAQDVAPSSELKNPEWRKNKGRPTEQTKRRKPLIELCEESRKKRAKKKSEPKKPIEQKPKRKARAKKCAWCNDEGHVVQDYSQMKLAMAREATRNEVVELWL
jgi:hypothetical protein